MDRITVEGYRCFRERQSARLAPLTLLVGNNSTGKTSFLALIRALWEVAFLSESPDFRRDPYDLGTFQDIAYYRGGRGGQVRSFEAGFERSPQTPVEMYSGLVLKETHREDLSFSARFEERGAVPFPVERHIGQGQTKLQAQIQRDDYHFRFETAAASGEYLVPQNVTTHENVQLLRFAYFLGYGHGHGDAIRHKEGVGDENTVTLYDTEITESDLRQIVDLAYQFEPDRIAGLRLPPFAGAPVRSRPRRTYDPVRPSRDPEGEYVPTYLANISRSDRKEWGRLKKTLEEFGQISGLFDEISIKSLGRGHGNPFQVETRKFGRKLKGASRNLIDVGYGVSQILPIITELLRKDSPSMFLLQQPEVHLHPSAQAALGSLFCNIVAEGERQVIVETHSDHLLDRVRMEVRGGETGIEPEDVSILYFEQSELDVNIYSIRLDENGNVLDAPSSYRKFFMEETRRSIGL